MNWRTKAKIQNFISILPSFVAESIYYNLQRKFGGLKKIDPRSRLKAGVEIYDRFVKHRDSIAGKIVLEVGTGRGVDLPIALWLLGAAKIYTIDLNSYLKAELIKESLDFIKNYPDEIKSILSNSISKERLEKLLLLDLEGDVISRLFELCNITYLAPADASKIELPANSIDLHLSYTVFEHIPQIDLIEILIEGNRLLRSDGLHIHLIDYSDHFSHSDDNISPINFLQYDEESWNSLAGNKYMYCNRLREDDVMSVFDKASIDLIQIESCKKEELRSLLSSNEFFLDEKFSTKSEDCLITTSTWLVGKPRH